VDTYLAPAVGRNNLPTYLPASVTLLDPSYGFT